MAIKDFFTRKSVSSSSSGGQTEATMTTTNTSDEAPTSPSSKRSSRLAKTWSWRSNKAFKEENTKPTKPKPKPQKQKQQRVHPSERPLTETNLRHQEMLSSFSFKFGSSRRRRMSHGQRTSFSGVSPGNSRQASLDQSVGSPGLGPVRGDRRVSSLAHDVPREDPRGEAEAE